MIGIHDLEPTLRQRGALATYSLAAPLAMCTDIASDHSKLKAVGIIALCHIHYATYR
jgi:hypothetical protein